MSVTLNRKIIFYCLIFISSNHQIIGQNLSGKVIYSKTYDSVGIVRGSSEKDKITLDFLEDKIRKATDMVSFELKFNSYQSTFEMIKVMESEISALDSRASVLIGGGKGVYYLNKKINSRLHQIESFGKTFLIESKLSEQKWILSKETKHVGKYLCYKAIFIPNLDNNKEEKKSKEIIAWYSKDIPINFGPIGFSNLPGLILELEYGNALYSYTDISFTDTIKIVMPKEGQKVSEPTFELISKRILDGLKEGN
ncbi:MAG: GLPGLI family protein [Aquaticitalea sp.]